MNARLASAVPLLTALLAVPLVAFTSSTVLTRSYDNARAGAVHPEITLTPERLAHGLPKRFSIAIPGEPRVEARFIAPVMNMPDGKVRDVRYAFSMATTSYALDAGTGRPLWPHPVSFLAARTSPSFRVLFAAIPPLGDRIRGSERGADLPPLYIIRGRNRLDLPVYLFDGLIPQWPTFGIDLEAKLPRHTSMVFSRARILKASPTAGRAWMIRSARPRAVTLRRRS